MHFRCLLQRLSWKLTFYAGLEDGQLLGHAPETTSLAFRHETASGIKRQSILTMQFLGYCYVVKSRKRSECWWLKDKEEKFVKIQ